MTQITAPRCIIYARISDEKQEDNFSIGTQLEACREYAEKHGYQIVGEYFETFTGTLLSRPQLDLVCEQVRRKEADIVLCNDPDRLSRILSHKILLKDEFKRFACRVEYVTMPTSDDPYSRAQQNMIDSF